jgi:hypothetical protein
VKMPSGGGLVWHPSSLHLASEEPSLSRMAEGSVREVRNAARYLRSRKSQVCGT